MEPITPISLERIKGLYPGLRPTVYRVLQDMTRSTRRVLNVARGIASWDDQLALYSRGRQLLPDGSWLIMNKGEIVTNAKPGFSWHCFGLAWDVSWAGMDPYLKAEPEHVRHDLWKEYGRCVKSYGCRWGGDSIRLINGVWDIPHAEMTFGLTLAEANELYEIGGLPGVWTHIDAIRGVQAGDGWTGKRS